MADNLSVRKQESIIYCNDINTWICVGIMRRIRQISGRKRNECTYISGRNY